MPFEIWALHPLPNPPCGGAFFILPNLEVTSMLSPPPYLFLALLDGGSPRTESSFPEII